MDELEICLRYESFLLMWNSLNNLSDFAFILRIVNSDYFEQNNDVNIEYLIIDDFSYDFSNHSKDHMLDILKKTNDVLQSLLLGKVSDSDRSFLQKKN